MIDDPLNRLKVKRGSELPQAKLNENDIKNIRQIVLDREQMRKALSAMSNAALAEKFNVHYRTIDRITAGENWSHVE